jgi:hypothetical protein
MGYTKDRTVPPVPNYTKIMTIIKNNHLTGNTEEPINFDSGSSTNHSVPFPCTADTSTFGKYEEYYCLNNDLFAFKEVNELEKDGSNPNQVIVEAIIDETVGPFYVREVGIFDSNGDLFAIGKFPETFKANLPSGSGKRYSAW